MTDDSSRNTFSSFWKRSVDKISSNQLTFLPPNQITNKREDREIDSQTPELSKDQLRRAQVRKAQTEHRKRKKNYAKYLEQDIINLRIAIATTHGEAASLQTENDNIKKVIWSNQSRKRNLPFAGHSHSDQTLGNSEKLLPFPNSLLESNNSYQDLDLNFRLSVTIDFDSTIEASCLQAHYSSATGPDISISTPTMFDFPAKAFTDRGINHHPNSLSPTPIGSHRTKSLSDEEIAEIAINFILALEHPCRTHFHPIPADFSPKESPTGHELMASTSLYAHAPSYVFSNPSDGVTWDHLSSPVAELQKLKNMNESLPKMDSEITPVQAWFLLVERFELAFLLGDESLRRKDTANGEGGFLEKLKRELSTLVDCFGFGAAMDSIIFWEAVELFNQI